ncbi:MAG: DUF2949 domain-containing protein [Candidatus Parcubacteria bacterium]|uniref:DUF2949 domain-containing protein n=1 Tax=Phormidesmis priestleyi TaxID=268141 RepID=UPI000839E0FD|nr:DUF2949 domain-containing protein [Leptolyngbyaceae cyanobacterium LF-bin-113]
MPVLPFEIIEQYQLEESERSPNRSNAQLIYFLQEDLCLAQSSIAMAIRYAKQERGPLPMVLWRYGLVSLEQLNQILDWLEK